MASDESPKPVHVDSTDIDKLLYGYPAEGYGGITKDPEKQMQIVDEDQLGDAGGYDLQQISSTSYEGSSAGSDWIDALTMESFTEDMGLPGLNEVAVSDYKGLLGKMAGISPDRVSKTKVTKALHIMAVKGSDSEDCRRTLTSADQKIRCNMDSSADALGRSSLTSKNLLKQSQFLNRIRLNADLSMIPASA
ncbi:MAG TPA: hypothetical protein VLB04_02845 [Methanotrichaceae archaeon]|nr:hypothetical protein [Methanotrichaceae archaeon]